MKLNLNIILCSIFILIVVLSIIYYFVYAKDFFSKSILDKNKVNKKNIVFLFCGESRTSPISLNNEKRSIDILNSYNKYIFTEEFKSKYNYKIFISTDDINLSDTFDYFLQENVENIHLLNTNNYYKNINSKLKMLNII